MNEIYSVLNGTRNEIVERYNWSEYRKAVGMNPSSLVHGLESMKKLKWEWDHPSKSTPAMAFGTACHTLLFEPREFEKRYAVWDGGSRRGKDYQDFKSDAFLERKKVLTEEEAEAAQEVAKSLLALEGVQDLIQSGQPEVAVFWTEGEMQCKGRLDWVTGRKTAIVDLKTARDLSESGRGRAFFSLHYDVKLGLYQRAFEKVTGVRYPVCVIWVENKPPYDVVIDDGWIPQAVLDAGVEKAMGVFRQLRRSLQTREWPGHGGPLFVPNWEMQDQIVEFHDEP